MSFINLDSTGWINVPAALRERVIEAELTEVVMRRADDDAELGPRTILKTGKSYFLPPDVAYALKANGARTGSGVRIFEALAVKDQRQGPAFDMFPITLDDSQDLPQYADAIYVGLGGNIAVVTLAGHSRVFPVADYSIIPIGVRRVLATGTTASSIFGIL